jgi:hypothetical protein
MQNIQMPETKDLSIFRRLVSCDNRITFFIISFMFFTVILDELCNVLWNRAVL